MPEDLSDLDGAYIRNISDKYLGANPLSVLNTNKRILTSILKLTGNQFSDFRTGEMCALLLVLVSTRAAAF